MTMHHLQSFYDLLHADSAINSHRLILFLIVSDGTQPPMAPCPGSGAVRSLYATHIHEYTCTNRVGASRGSRGFNGIPEMLQHLESTSHRTLKPEWGRELIAGTAWFFCLFACFVFLNNGPKVAI